MKLYEYDAQGWLIGWHEDVMRSSSTPIEPTMPPVKARWNGTDWITDATREQAQIVSDADARTKRQQAIAFLRAFDPNTATASDVKNAVAAIIRILPSL